MSQTIILIHGFRGTHHGLELIAKNLGEFTTVIPDLPGFATGPQLEKYDLDSYVAWLHDFIAYTTPNERPILLGHSFGSIISAAYASRYPTTISKLVLVNPIGAPALEGPRAIMSQLVVFYYWLGQKMPNSFARRWLSSNLVIMVMSSTMAKTKDRKLRAFIYDQHRKYFSLFHSPASVGGGFKTSISHSVRDFATQINTPTLLIAGDKDDITPLQKQKDLVKMFPNAQLTVIENVGHLTHYETPDQVAEAIQAFIKPS